MLEIGSVIDGKYKVLSEIGHGGMSVVYMVINEKANKTWAVKEVRKQGVLDFESVRQGLIVETNMLKKLRHNNLPSIVDVIDTDDAFLIVMDYIEGNSLADILAEEGALPQEDVIEWAIQLCDVLGYLHTRTPAIIYRDMKPANIMLKPDGHITLIDFGTAREYKEKNLADTTCLGTIGYAAPEQFGKMGQTDERTDIYCLGTTLYHLLTGHNPSEPPYEIKPIREINPALSTGLESIILKCTQRNPDDRFQSCAELSYALKHYEKADDEYKQKQKQKLGMFMSFAITTLVFFMVGLVTQITSSQILTEGYDDYIKKGDIDSLLTAIGIQGKASEEEAYLKIIDLYKEDGTFDEREEKQLLEKILNDKNSKELKQNKNNYIDVCLAVGELYWFYYDGEDTEKQKHAREWFSVVPEGHQYRTMTETYTSIGEFQTRYLKAKMEGSDGEFFKESYDNLLFLLDKVFDNGNESELVKLEVILYAQPILQLYSNELNEFGIDFDTQMELYNRLERYLDSIDGTSSTKAKEKKQEALEQMKTTKHNLDTNITNASGGVK